MNMVKILFGNSSVIVQSHVSFSSSDIYLFLCLYIPKCSLFNLVKNQRYMTRKLKLLANCSKHQHLANRYNMPRYLPGLPCSQVLKANIDPNEKESKSKTM